MVYPDIYQRFLDGINVLNFDLGWIPSVGCIIDVDFHDRLLVLTIGPIIAMVILTATFTVAIRRCRGSSIALRRVRHKHVSMALLVTFLVYSSVSAAVFQTFACEHLADGKEYLRADYRIECDSSRHKALQVYAAIMIFVYPVGIPLLYAILLYRNRRVLMYENAREASPKVQTISDLWSPYKPQRFYYEVVECMRRISLTGVVVFIYPNSASQIAITLVIALAFMVVSERLAPYASRWEGYLSLTGHLIVFISMFVALLLKVEVSDERDTSQRIFAGVLVFAQCCMIVAVLVEAVVMACSVRHERN